MQFESRYINKSYTVHFFKYFNKLVTPFTVICVMIIQSCVLIPINAMVQSLTTTKITPKRGNAKVRKFLDKVT